MAATEDTAMANRQNDDSLDKNFTQHKKNILRSSDIMPPFNKKEVGSAKPPKNAPHQDEIPTFDLSGEMTAQQRKLTAVKRKPPFQRTEQSITTQDAGAAEYTQPDVTQPLPERDEIISEIVARDIERFCRG